MSIFRELGVREGKGRGPEELLYNLASSYILIERQIEKTLEPFGLSPVKMNTLLIIKHVGKSKGLSQVEIGRRMIVSAGNITRLIDRLEREDFVERTTTADRRVKLIRITEKGSRLLDKAWPHYKREVNGIASAIPDEKITEIVKTLEKLRQTLKGSERC